MAYAAFLVVGFTWINADLRPVRTSEKGIWDNSSQYGRRAPANVQYCCMRSGEYSLLKSVAGTLLVDETHQVSMPQVGGTAPDCLLWSINKTLSGKIVNRSAKRSWGRC